MVSLKDLMNSKNNNKSFKTGVYELYIDEVNYELNKIDKNDKEYEMWKFVINIKGSKSKIFKNILIYKDEELGKISRNQFFKMIDYLNIDYENLDIEEEKFNDYLKERFKGLELVSKVFIKKGEDGKKDKHEVAWLYSIDEKDKALEKYNSEGNNSNIQEIEENVESYEKDEKSSEEVIEVEESIDKKNNESSNDNGNIDFTKFINIEN